LGTNGVVSDDDHEYGEQERDLDKFVFHIFYPLVVQICQAFWPSINNATEP
jgi:hypothetical protein